MCRGEKFGTPGSIKILRLVFATFEGIKLALRLLPRIASFVLRFPSQKLGQHLPLELCFVGPQACVFYTRR